MKNVRTRCWNFWGLIALLPLVLPGGSAMAFEGISFSLLSLPGDSLDSLHVKVMGIGEENILTLYDDAACTEEVGTANSEDFIIELRDVGKGTHRYYFSVFDGQNRSSSCLAAHFLVHIMDDLAPPKLALSLETPEGTDMTPDIVVTGAFPTGLVNIYSDSNCVVKAAPPSQVEDGDSDLRITVFELEGLGDYTFYANITDSAGNQSSCSNGKTYTLDEKEEEEDWDFGDIPLPPEEEKRPINETEVDIYVHNINLFGKNRLGFINSRISERVNLNKSTYFSLQLSLDHLIESQRNTDESFGSEKFISEGHIHKVFRIKDKKLILRLGKQSVVIGQGLSGVFLTPNPYLPARMENGVLAARVDVTDFIPNFFDLDRVEIAVFESGEDFIAGDLLRKEFKKYFTEKEIQQEIPLIFARYGVAAGGRMPREEDIRGPLSHAYPGKDLSHFRLPRSSDLSRYQYSDWRFNGGVGYSINVDKKLGRNGFSVTSSHTLRKNAHLSSGVETLETAGLKYISNSRKFRAWGEFFHTRNNPVFSKTKTKNGVSTGFVWSPSPKFIFSGEGGHAHNNFSNFGSAISYLPHSKIILTSEINYFNFSDDAIRSSGVPGFLPPLIRNDVSFGLRLGFVFGKRSWFERTISRTNRRLDGRPE